jgi:hypothetical protein
LPILLSQPAMVFVEVTRPAMALANVLGLPGLYPPPTELQCPWLYVKEECVSTSLWYGPVTERCECRFLWQVPAIISILLFICVLKCVPWIANVYEILSQRDVWCSRFAELLMRVSRQPRVSTRVVRQAFGNMPPVKTTLPSNHTHAVSAARRSQASSEMTYLGQHIGLTPFYLQQSASDQKVGRAGSRSYFWAKDLTASRSDMIPDPEMLAIVDVDYYIDMPNLLSSYCVPTALYTLVPQSVATSTGEYSMTFDKKDQVVYSVSGGATYSHGLWDYGSDVVIAERTYLGFWHVSVAYNVDRRQIDADHQLVLLTPMARTSCPFVKMSHLVDGKELTRLRVCEEVVVDGVTEVFTRLDIQTATGLRRSTGRAGLYVEANIPASVDDALQLQSSLGKVDLTIAQVKTTTGLEDMTSAAVLTTYHRNAITTKPNTVFPVSSAVRSFTFSPASYSAEEKPVMVPFMSPIALGATLPSNCAANESQAIKGRVTSVLTPDIELDATLVGHMEEFTSFMIPPHLVHTACPVDYDVIRERQSRPTQRRILDAAANTGGLFHGPVTSMMKKESYAKVTDPRNITIIPPQNKLAYSAYLYAFADRMRSLSWYAFGKTPYEIAERVSEICGKAQAVSMTDLARCDGRISNVCRHLERMVMLRFFKVDYHAELLKTMETQFQQRAFTNSGEEYKTGNSRLSGSSETADFNSTDNAFIAYRGFRLMGFSPEEAYSRLGIYGGDDGLTADMDPVAYQRSAASIGQVLEEETVKRGNRGVNFLSRYYSPFVWTGDSDSMCDLKRQIIKFHLTTALGADVTPLMKLREKCRGFYLSDRNTPVIGAFASAVEGLFGPSEMDERLRGVASYHAELPDDEQYPNANVEGWMNAEALVNFPSFDFKRFAKWLNTVRDGASPLSPPVCCEELAPCVPPADVVVDGDIVRAKAQSSASSSAPAAAVDVKTECQFYKEGKCSYGAKCKFLHVGDVAQARPCCNMFKTTGVCRFGDKCKYEHVAAVHQPQASGLGVRSPNRAAPR